MMLFLNCKQAYTPPAITSSVSYLVVEGVINNSSDSTIIKLSHTVNIASKVKSSPVLNATVAIQGDQNVTYPLTEKSNGTYFTTNLNLDNAHKYRLIITTADNKQYYSDYVPVLNSPPLDSVYYTLSNNTVNINTVTHDASNKVKFFRWDYKETYIIYSAFQSDYKSDGYNIYLRDFVNDNIYQCWASDTSSTIVLNSTDKLNESLLTNNIVTFFPQNSEKVGYRYSIIVNQYALTTEAYNFWTNLKKNTEKLGSIFDAQPSQINGNIHCSSNPAEPVIGYISAGTVASKRIFINHEQLPKMAPNFSTASCELDSIWYCTPYTCEDEVDEVINYKRGNFGVIIIPIRQFKDSKDKLLGYLGASAYCADCTLRGTNRKPDFWK